MLSNDDEEVIQKLYNWLVVNFPRFKFKIKESLKNILPKPESRWLENIWKFGHADISVYRHNELSCIVEPGGWYHAKDKKQRVNDLKKDTLCKINGVNCLRFFNNVVEDNLGMLKTKRLFKKYFYGKNLS